MEKFFVGNQLTKMANLTRDVLIKSIVAEEMRSNDGNDYSKHLKNMYHKWNHVSSLELCDRYNFINNTQISVDILAS